MSIRFKLLSTISVCALAFVVFGAIARDTVSTTKINGPWYMKIVQGKDLIADILPPPEYIVEAHLIAYQMVSETDGTRLKALGDRWKSVREDYQTRHDYWETNLPAGSMKDELLNASYRPAIAFFQAVERDVIPAVQRNDREAASAVVRNTLKPLYEEHRSSIDKIVKMADEAAKKDESQVADIIGSRTFLLTSLAFVILGAMLFCGLYMNHLSTSIIGRVGRAMAFATGIAKGDMTQSLDSGKKDEIGQLIDALTTMQTSMREMIADVAQGVGTQASASTELSGISAQMASSVQAMSQKASEIAQAAAESSTNTASVAAGMEEMTVSLTSVAGATEEMSATVLEIASNSEKARSISAAASHQAAAVSGMMQELGRAAKEIGQVTETITSISAQTNLLALNATIEAARAGAAGKGFAVVANEIKELAQQTATATEDIKSKISGIQSSTDNAVNDIGQITGVISEVGELVNTIAAAIEEQSVASRDIASNIAQVSSGITDSNQRVAQAAAASQSIADYIGEVNGTTVELSSWGQQVQSRAFELSSLAEHLSESVQRFKLSEDGSTATRGNSQKTFAEWSSQLSVAVPSMDEQHKRFLNILNDLHVAMKGGRGASVITGTLRELSEYARYHFGEEEAVMRKHNFPDLAKHQEVHRQFVQKVNDLQDRWAGGDESVVFDTLITVRDWFINHIKHVDKKYAPYVH